MIQKNKKLFFAFAMIVIAFNSIAQTKTEQSKKSNSIFAVEIDPIVPFALHGIGGHLMWQPKKSAHLVYGFAFVAFGKMPDFIMNLNSINKGKGWNYEINQGFGIEAEYYYKEANIGLFSGLQLFTQEINLTNDNVPSVTEHRTNIGMAVITTGYKWYPFKKQHLYLKPWAGIGYSGIIKGAFSSKVIPNAIVGSYEYDIQKLTPFATIHIGYKF